MPSILRKMFSRKLVCNYENNEISCWLYSIGITKENIGIYTRCITDNGINKLKDFNPNTLDKLGDLYFQEFDWMLIQNYFHKNINKDKV